MKATRTVAIPLVGIQTHKKLVQDDDIGSQRIFMDILPKLDAPPMLILTPLLIKQTMDEDNVFVTSVDLADETGYHVNLSGPAVEGQTIQGFFVPA